ncbi:FKBP-type peptidyl-prolyl cis-trans isomerase [Mariniflexile gromovii]|uniref:Peptidyl-prolyl cis-trans isomerase n=1 Tax=Mariniflexile gromovii TaxID=362523 RepID=A0ABS4BRP3_9FLAO|nr:FKBP-type peptidyl-prolyl cis-trans isomerase [Mariniflexile gromovii]MBP0903202.1 FKBP-type peptidyl-prolyl cis-trans isomerase [Mariniflexile gromovii]
MKIIKFLGVVLTASILSSCGGKGASNKALKTEIDSVSYAIGMDVAKNVKTSVSEIDSELFIQGYMNVLDSTNILLKPEDGQQILSAYFQKKQAENMKKQQEEAEKGKAVGEKFLEENKSKDGIKVTESGLQYKVLKEGTGAKPTAESKVKVHYHGTLIDGTVFDSSVERGEPTEFGVGQVIRGWTEGLQLMSVGSKYKFFIPQDLAYGARQAGEKIKPYSTLIFEVELLEIVE